MMIMSGCPYFERRSDAAVSEDRRTPHAIRAHALYYYKYDYYAGAWHRPAVLVRFGHPVPTPRGPMNPLETYPSALLQASSTGAATSDISFYPALSTLACRGVTGVHHPPQSFTGPQGPGIPLLRRPHDAEAQVVGASADGA